jgi:hypothetical protein
VAGRSGVIFNHGGGRRRLPEDNVARFRNRLRGLRDRWRAGAVTRPCLTGLMFKLAMQFALTPFIRRPSTLVAKDSTFKQHLPRVFLSQSIGGGGGNGGFSVSVAVAGGVVRSASLAVGVGGAGVLDRRVRDGVSDNIRERTSSMKNRKR